MNKVLFIGHTAGLTGAPIVLRNLIWWLRKNTGIECELILRQSGPLLHEYQQLCKTTVLPGFHLKFSSPVGRRAMGRASRVLSSFALGRAARQRWDVVYSNTIINGAEVAVLARERVPVVTHVHELEFWIQRCGTKNMDSVKAHTSRYIAASHAVKTNLVERHGIQQQRIEVIPEFIRLEERALGVSPNAIASRFHIPAGAFVIGGSGAEFWRKGRDLVPQLLDRARTLCRPREVHFLWVGPDGLPDEEEKLRYDLDKLGLSDFFHRTGEVRNPMDYFQVMDVFLLLSRDDPFPLVCLEAAMLRKPLICFADSGGIPDLIQQDAGFVVSYLDVNAMAEKVAILAASPDKAVSMGQAANARVRSMCNVQFAAPKVLEVIQSAARSRASDGPIQSARLATQ